VSGAFHWLDRRLGRIAPFLGTRHVVVIVALAILGTWALVAQRRLALALATPMLVLIAMGASAARKYPFLDLRTSLFWLVAVVALMAFGVARVVVLLARRNRGVAAVALVAVAAVWLHQAAPYAGEHVIPVEPLGADVEYLNAHRRPTDVVVVSFSAVWGFAFHERWTPFGVVELSDPPAGAPDFLPTFARDPRIVVARGFEASAVRAAVDAGSRLLRRQSSARLWIVLAHTEKREQRVWQAALAAARIPVRTDAPGPWRAG
jgi:hypothetical protein